MAKTETDQSDLAAIAEDVAKLRRDLATLMTHVKEGGADIAQDTLEKISKEARDIYRAVAAEGEHSLKAMSKRVEEQPIASILIAFGIGLIAGKLLSR
jgi:ElaB/YqjD/DUF883 family membrane-anchored ribosome-binding protein